ncbi:gamma-glutamyltransferase [Terrabacter sp. NPDC000476]|uniref:gamma-glutamyltransferase n=1 Tax=Terrabacter sp. NPDC000476 TaxID=3154258 RepID=UPI003329AB13
MSRSSARTTTRSRWVLGALVVGLPLSLLPATATAGATPAPAPAPSSGASTSRHDGGWHGHPTDLPKVPVMKGGGGAVSSVDRDASQVGIDVLRRGGNAADAAVATAAALGVTEPYSTGIGGGGFLVYYDARSRRVSTIDGRETAPATFTSTSFTDPSTGKAMDFTTVVNSGLSVGVPGTPALWAKALRDHGTLSLNRALAPAEQLARKGFVVDQTFADQTAANAERFSVFPETARVFLRDGKAPAVGSTFRNPDMARAYRTLRTQGVSALYSGSLGRAVVAESRAPHTDGSSVMGGQLTMRDLRAYRALTKAPIHSSYKGFDVFGMPVPSSGGIAVAEILNLMRAYEKATGVRTSALSEADYLHRFSEASATAFADRNRWVGDVPGVPVRQLTNPAFAAERACLFDPAKAQPRPIPFGSPDGRYTSCAPGKAAQPEPYEGLSTSHLTVMDRWGSVASYTLTIEQTGGSGITVPGYGFLLNNELTDFNFTPLTPGVPDPNLPGPGKRPRSSMSPTILLHEGRPFLAVGSPGGATIITSTSQTILGYLDRRLSLVDAIRAPRLSSRNGSSEGAEPQILDGPVGAALTAKGHVLAPGAAAPAVNEIGAVTAIRYLGHGRFEAAAETTRRGGGSAMVVQPSRHPRH